jgi:hypothetical protein
MHPDSIDALLKQYRSGFALSRPFYHVRVDHFIRWYLRQLTGEGFSSPIQRRECALVAEF